MLLNVKTVYEKKRGNKDGSSRGGGKWEENFSKSSENEKEKKILPFSIKLTYFVQYVALVFISVENFVSFIIEETSSRQTHRERDRGKGRKSKGKNWDVVF